MSGVGHSPCIQANGQRRVNDLQFLVTVFHGYRAFCWILWPSSRNWFWTTPWNLVIASPVHSEALCFFVIILHTGCYHGYLKYSYLEWIILSFDTNNLPHSVFSVCWLCTFCLYSETSALQGNYKETSKDKHSRSSFYCPKTSSHLVCSGKCERLRQESPFSSPNIRNLEIIEHVLQNYFKLPVL